MIFNSMRKLLLFVFSLLTVGIAFAEKSTFTVLQWNIWQEGTVVKDGYDAIVDEIVRLKPDFVTFSEVRNYHNTRFCDRIVESLAKRGETYYSFYSDDSGLLTRNPIIDSTTVYPLHNDQGTCYRALTSVNGRELALYTCHLDYRSCAYYNVRGYHGSTWKEIPVPTSIAEVLAFNDASVRDDAIRNFIKMAKEDIAKGRLVMIGGDFNEPSHLDWIRETKDLYDHHGLIIPWTVTLLLDNAGFKDSYRVKYPNVLKYPGFTYPSDNVDMPANKLSWTPKADERERIDYIFYYPDPKLELKDAIIYGPSGCIVRNQRVANSSKDRFLKPEGTWPTDHKGLLVTFKLKK